MSYLSSFSQLREHNAFKNVSVEEWLEFPGSSSEQRIISDMFLHFPLVYDNLWSVLLRYRGLRVQEIMRRYMFQFRIKLFSSCLTRIFSLNNLTWKIISHGFKDIFSNYSRYGEKNDWCCVFFKGDWSQCNDYYLFYTMLVKSFLH